MDFVTVPGHAGMIGMTSLPGGRRALNNARALATDLEEIRRWGAEILLSLNEPWEYGFYGDPRLPESIPQGIRHLQMPIPDRGVPDAAWEDLWAIHGEEIREVLRRGGRVCVHCVGGHGRTGTIVAKLLVEFGLTPEHAIAEVRRARPDTIETRTQERYIQEAMNPERRAH